MKEIEEKYLEQVVAKKLGKSIVKFSLIGQGMCNNAWYVKTDEELEYLVKQEKFNKDTDEQNDLLVEAELLKKLNENNPSLLVPKIVYISEDPKMYCYDFISGDTMQNSWEDLVEEDRKLICENLGKFHADLGKSLTPNEIETIHLKINQDADFEKETQESVHVFLTDDNIPNNYKSIVEQVIEIFSKTKKDAVFGLSHNDSHHENILVNKGKFVSMVDFGDTEYGDIHAGLTRYIQDYPDYAEIVFSSYEKYSGNKLSRERLVAHTILNAVEDIRIDFQAGGNMMVLEEYLKWFEKFAHNPFILGRLDSN